MIQNKSFFEQIQNTEGLDLRDNRGLIHDMALVVIGVVLALLSNRDGKLSSVQRHMKNNHAKLTNSLNIKSEKSVSRSQLPIILSKIDLSIFQQLLFVNYGVILSDLERVWFSVDGKELRGSIQKGNKRGEAIIQAVSHQGRTVVAQSYYDGIKESEIPTTRKLLEDNGLDKQKITLDALHSNPDTLQQINQAKGIYLVGLKENQRELLEECQDTHRFCKPNFSFTQIPALKDKHGRDETRTYEVYDIAKQEKHQRWSACKIETLIVVKRDFTKINTKVKSSETSFYISNQSDNYLELSLAVRGHWNVETNNYIRDVVFSEDKLKTKKKNYHKQ